MISPKTFVSVNCAICGQPESQIIAREGQFGWPTYVSICKNCGLVYLNPRWTKEDYNYFYAKEYDQFYRFDEDEAAEKEIRKAKVVWARLSEHAGSAYQAALDIGCGLGWNLNYIASQSPGVAIAGIEPSDTCAEHFVNQIGGELIARDVDADWHLSQQERFDLIIFRHVLEHLMDPVEALKKVGTSLAPAGVLYVAVPDMMHPDGSLQDFWFRCVHTYYFSKDTLTWIAARAGLQPVVIREENSELWGIFRKSPLAQKTVPGSVYAQQMAALHQYKQKRFVRSLLLFFSPQKISRWIPQPLKNLIPSNFKAKFRRLVYRH